MALIRAIGGAAAAEIIAIKGHVTGTSGGTETFTTQVDDIIVVTGGNAIAGHITVSGATDVTSTYSSIIAAGASDFVGIYKATGSSVSVTNDATVANRSSVQIRGL